MNSPAPCDVVVSLAGHDRGKLYQVVGVREERLLLCDGRNRRLENPKRKSPRHVSVAVKSASAPATDREIRRTISLAANAAAKEEGTFGKG